MNTTHPTTHDRSFPIRNRTGFTLVEMLVAVGLVLLMMSLFAQVFQIAAGTVSTQRGIMENDQRARSVMTVIHRDLSNRTFRYVWPWAPGANTTPQQNSEDERLRAGYFYISENDPFDDTDDVLQFTGKMSTTTSTLAETDAYFGRAIRLGNVTNQPDYDDGELGNETSMSSQAEITFFMRRGREGRPGALYRRIHLIREPADITAQIQPHEDSNTANTLFDPASGATLHYTPGTATTFWKDFDFSARPVAEATFGNTPPSVLGVKFNELADLQLPTNRFGFQFADGSPDAGKPREFHSGVFFGRYTMEETSNLQFQYPYNATNSPMSLATTGITVNATTGVVTPLQHNSTNGSRRGEDLLLSNVVSFDIKVWDDFANNGAGGFVDIGGPGSLLYSTDPTISGNPDHRTNINFGPGGSTGANRVFDTWNPSLRLRSAPGDPTEPPPFLPRRYTAGASASAMELPRFASNTVQGAVLPELAGAVSSIPGDPVYFVRSGASAGTTNPAGTTLPLTLPIVYGAPILDNAGVEWTPVDNRRPLRLIQITIRFIDQTSQQLRTMTMQCDLTP